MGRTKREVIKSYYRLRTIGADDRKDEGYLEICCCDYTRKPHSKRIGIKIKSDDWDPQQNRVLNLPWNTDSETLEEINRILKDSLTQIDFNILRVTQGNMALLTGEAVEKILQQSNPSEKIKQIKKFGFIKSAVIPEKTDFSEVEYDKIENYNDLRNEERWLDFTIKETLQYCVSMLELTGVKKTQEEIYPILNSYMRKVNNISNKYNSMMDTLNKEVPEKEKREKKKELWQRKQKELEILFNKEMSVFEKLKSFIHEEGKDPVFQPNHLMYKVARFRDEAHQTTYEFIFEYDIFEPHVEIYYGIKAISDFPHTEKDFLQFVEQVADGFKDYMINGTDKTPAVDYTIDDEKNKPVPLKADKRMKVYSKRIKLTNNANDGTFWLVWVRKDSRDSLATDVEDLEFKLKNHFKDFYELRKRHGFLKIQGTDLFQSTRILQLQLSGLSPILNLYKYLKTKIKLNKKEFGIKERIEQRVKDYLSKGYLQEILNNEGAFIGEYLISDKFQAGNELVFLELLFNQESRKRSYYKLMEEDYDGEFSDEYRVFIPDRFIRDAFLRYDGSRFTEKEIKGLKNSLADKNVIDFIKLYGLD